MQIQERISEWFFKPLATVAPYLRTNYWLNGQTVTVKRSFSRPFFVRIHDLDEIGVETTDQGPFVEDVFWVLRRSKTRLRIGDPHPISKMLMECFQSLEGFDWRPFIEAQICTDNRYFVCWRRVSAPEEQQQTSPGQRPGATNPNDDKP